MHVNRHKITDIPFQEARWMGGEMSPEIVVLHDTASRLDRGNAAAYLADNEAKVSVHFVIERDGTITQQVPLNRVAYHAGRSVYHGKKHCNGFSIGIELVNPGRMVWADRDQCQARAWWGELFEDGHDTSDVQEVTTPEHGTGVWMSYPTPQIAAVLLLLETLFRDIESLRDITTHWYISPGRKVDVNPLFPLEAVRAKVLGRDDPADEAAEADSGPVRDAGVLRIITGGSGLNMRRWPSFNPNILLSIPDGTVVEPIREGCFGGRTWALVRFDGREGWIVKNPYTQTI